MPNICTNSLRIIGSHEAVAEVAMHLCQTHHVEVFGAEPAAFSELGIESGFRLPPEAEVVGWSIESFGTRELPEEDSAPKHFALALMFKTAWSPSEALLEALSQRFPDVVVGEVYYESLNAFWGALAYAGGKRLMNFAIEDAPVPESWQQRFDDADDDEAQRLHEELDVFRDKWGLEQLHDVAVAQLESRQLERTAGIMGRLRQHGWPRWSLVAHAANAEGFSGLKAAFMQLDTAEQMASALEAEFHAASELGVASWVDTALFGDATPTLPLEADLDMEVGGPYAALSLDGFRDRHLELLGAIGQTAGDAPDSAPLASALLASLSNPELRLSCKLHPAVFLAASAAAALADGQLYPTAATGIELVLSRLAARTPRLEGAGSLGNLSGDPARMHASEPMLRSVLALASTPYASPSQLKPAHAAGVPPQFLLRTLLSSSAAPAGHSEALGRLAQTLGGAQAFPTRLLEEIASIGPDLMAAHQALVTAEQMRSHISTAGVGVQASPAPARRAARV